MPEERGFQGVICGIHHSTPTDDIHKDLEALGFSVRAVTNTHHTATKTPLPLFLVELNKQSTNQTIF
jgi:hypothetical protein